MKKAPSPITAKEPSDSRNYTTILTKLTQSLYNALLALNLYASIAGVYLIDMAYALYSVLGGV